MEDALVGIHNWIAENYVIINRPESKHLTYRKKDTKIGTIYTFEQLLTKYKNEKQMEETKSDVIGSKNPKDITTKDLWEKAEREKGAKVVTMIFDKEVREKNPANIDGSKEFNEANGKSIAMPTVDTETLDQRKARTVILLSLDTKRIEALTKVAEQTESFLVIGDEKVFDEFFDRFVSDAIKPEVEDAVEQFYKDKANIKKALELATMIGTKMGFDKLFSYYKLPNMFPWKLDDAKEKMNVLMKFGFATVDLNDNRWFAITIDKSKRMEQVTDNIKQYLKAIELEKEALDNYFFIGIDDKDVEATKKAREEKREFKEMVQEAIGGALGVDVKEMRDLFQRAEKIKRERKCTLAQAMIFADCGVEHNVECKHCKADNWVEVEGEKEHECADCGRKQILPAKQESL